MSTRTDPASSDSVTLPGVGVANDEGMSSADLFASYEGRIRRYILGMVRDPVEAEDLTQEVFLRAHRKLGTVRDPDALTSWLYRIATHICYDRYRKKGREPRLDPLDMTGSDDPSPRPEESEQPSIERVMERAEMSACVRKYLEELSDQYRQVILLKDLEGMTNPEIAHMLEVSLDTVKIRLHRARRRLQKSLIEHCDFAHDDHGVFVCEPAPAAPDAP